MVGLRQDVLLDGNELFRKFKGALTEQYVLQQLKTLKGISTCYWTAERAAALGSWVDICRKGLGIKRISAILKSTSVVNKGNFQC